MTIHCVACRRLIQIPEERAANPRLKIKCACGALFALGEAAVAAAPTQPVSPPPRPAAAEPARGPAPAAPAPPVEPRRPASTATAAPRPPAAPARPAAPQAPPPAERSRVSFQATSAVGAPAEPPAARSGSWRRCGTHPQARSASVCPQCLTGYCPECQHKVGVSVLCPKCEVICIETSAHEERLQRERLRARPMMEELPTIFGYPLRDPMAFVMLAVFTGVFAALGKFAAVYGQMIALLFSQGVLMAYCFSALSRVSGGNMKDFMPDIGDITDLVRTLRLGVTALIAGSGPLVLMMILIPGLAIFGLGGLGGIGGPAQAEQASVPQEAPMPPVFDGEGNPIEVEPVSTEVPDGPATPSGLTLLGLAASVIVFGGLGLLWKVIYTPVALTVAGISRSVWSTLNPVVGFDTMRRMGGTYWQAMGIYTVVALAQWLIGFILGFIPILGFIVNAFVDAYAYLMIGCTLGLAVFKKAPELGLD